MRKFNIFLSACMGLTTVAFSGFTHANLSLLSGKCKTPMGTIRIVEPDDISSWQGIGLSAPTRILRVFVNDSKCFTVVDRGSAFNAAQLERNLASSGVLKSGQNIGAGQMKAADYVLVPDLIGRNFNAGGSNVGIGGGVTKFVGSLAGGGSYTSRKKSAQVVLTLIDVRTSEQVASVTAEAKVTDRMLEASLQGRAPNAKAQAGASNYTNSEIGVVITEAYEKAFKDLIKDTNKSDLINRQNSAPQAVVQSSANISEPNQIAQSQVVQVQQNNIQVQQNYQQSAQMYSSTPPQFNHTQQGMPLNSFSSIQAQNVAQIQPVVQAQNIAQVQSLVQTQAVAQIPTAIADVNNHQIQQPSAVVSQLSSKIGEMNQNAEQAQNIMSSAKQIVENSVLGQALNGSKRLLQMIK